jgi:hypothetical protein
MTRYRFRFPATVAPLSAKSPSATPGFWRGPPVRADSRGHFDSKFNPRRFRVFSRDSADCWASALVRRLPQGGQRVADLGGGHQPRFNGVRGNISRFRGSRSKVRMALAATDKTSTRHWVVLAYAVLHLQVTP